MIDFSLENSSKERKYYFENKYFEMWLEDGIVINVYKPKVNITLEIAKQITEQRIKTTENFPRPILVDVRKGSTIDKAARDFWGKDKAAHKFLTAGAIVVKNQMQKFVALAFIALSKEPVPTRIFASVKEARSFLQVFKYDRMN